MPHRAPSPAFKDKALLRQLRLRPPCATLGRRAGLEYLADAANLQGMARELAKHSVLGSFSDGQLVLNLAPQHKHLQTNKMAHEKLQAALSEYFARPVRLSVELGASNAVATPPPSNNKKNKHVSSRQ